MTTTPWGPAQHTTVIADGITFYSTAGHGGIHLSPERNEMVAPKYRAYADRWSKGWGDRWYEEDCAALAVILTFPEHFPSNVNDLASIRETLEGYVNGY